MNLVCSALFESLEVLLKRVGSKIMGFVGISNDRHFVVISFEVEVEDSNGKTSILSKMIRLCLLEMRKDNPNMSSIVREIESKLKEVDLKCQVKLPDF